MNKLVLFYEILSYFSALFYKWLWKYFIYIYIYASNLLVEIPVLLCLGCTSTTLSAIFRVFYIALTTFWICDLEIILNSTYHLALSTYHLVPYYCQHLYPSPNLEKNKKKKKLLLESGKIKKKMLPLVMVQVTFISQKKKKKSHIPLTTNQ